MRVKIAGSILIVEDDPNLAQSLANLARDWADVVMVTGTIIEARRVIMAESPSIVILDFMLPDGDALDLLEMECARLRAPAVVAISAMAHPADTFRLAQLGVRAFLEKPFSLASLEDALRSAVDTSPDITPLVRAAVGSIALKNMEVSVRRAMVDEALSRSEGSRRGAARILGVSRQFLQHALRK